MRAAAVVPGVSSASFARASATSRTISKRDLPGQGRMHLANIPRLAFDLVGQDHGLDTLAPGGEVVLLLYREPTPLYDILRRNGYTHRTELNEAGEFAIHIRQAA